MSKLIVLYKDNSIEICKEKKFKYSKKMETVLIPMVMEGLLDGFIPVYASKYMNFTKAEINTQISKTFEDYDYENEKIDNFPAEYYTTTSLIELYNYLHSFKKLEFANTILSSNLECGIVSQFIIIGVDIKLFEKDNCVYEYHYNALEEDCTFNVETLDIFKYIFDYNKGNFLKLNLSNNRWSSTDKIKSKNVNVVYGQLLYYTMIYSFDHIDKYFPSNETMNLDIFSINAKSMKQYNIPDNIVDREEFDDFIYDDLDVYDVFPISYVSQKILLYEILVYYHYLSVIVNIVYHWLGAIELVYQLYSPVNDGCRIYTSKNINKILVGGYK